MAGRVEHLYIHLFSFVSGERHSEKYIIYNNCLNLQLNYKLEVTFDFHARHDTTETTEAHTNNNNNNNHSSNNSINDTIEHLSNYDYMGSVAKVT